MREIFIAMGLHHPFTPIRQFEFERTDGWVKLFKVQWCGFLWSHNIGPTENKQVGYSIPGHRHFPDKQRFIFAGA